MNRLTVRTLLLLAGLLLSASAAASGAHDPILTMLRVDKLETHVEDGPDPLLFSGDLWIGKDLHKLWLRSDGGYRDGNTTDLRLDLMYGAAVSPFWDLLVGWSRRIEPQPDKDWLALTLKGMAPQLLETELNLYADDNGLVKLSAQVEYEYLFTQRLVLSPELALSAWNKDAAVEGAWAGLESVEGGLRLRYEVRRELAPYLGVERRLHFGDAARAMRAGGADIGGTSWLAGVRFWF